MIYRNLKDIIVGAIHAAPINHYVLDRVTEHNIIATLDLDCGEVQVQVTYLPTEINGDKINDNFN